MSKYEKALLTRIFRGPLPMTLTDQADLDAVRILHGCGYVDVVFERPSKGEKAGAGSIGTAVVKRVLNPLD
jgi:hypothetical protein